MRSSVLLRIKLGPRLALAVDKQTASPRSLYNSQTTSEQATAALSSWFQFLMPGFEAYRMRTKVESLSVNNATCNPIKPEKRSAAKPRLRIAIRRSFATGEVVTVDGHDAQLSNLSKTMPMSELIRFVNDELAPRITKHEKPLALGEHVIHQNLNCSCCDTRSYVGLVVCGVSKTPLALQLVARAPPSTHGDHLSTFTIGVNFALHRLVNNNMSRSEAIRVLPGLLKGCAEQNALGAFAARGTEPYSAIRTIVLHGRRVSINGSGVPAQRDRGWWRSMFPCLQCWNHIKHIADLGDGKTPLRLCVTMAENELNILKEALSEDFIDRPLEADASVQWFRKHYSHFVLALREAIVVYSTSANRANPLMSTAATTRQDKTLSDLDSTNNGNDKLQIILLVTPS